MYTVYVEWVIMGGALSHPRGGGGDDTLTRVSTRIDCCAYDKRGSDEVMTYYFANTRVSLCTVCLLLLLILILPTGTPHTHQIAR